MRVSKFIRNDTFHGFGRADNIGRAPGRGQHDGAAGVFDGGGGGGSGFVNAERGSRNAERDARAPVPRSAFHVPRFPTPGALPFTGSEGSWGEKTRNVERG